MTKPLVKGGLCRRFLVWVSYTIGVSHPFSTSIFQSGTSQKNEKESYQDYEEKFYLSLRVTIRDLDIKKPIYQRTADYGHIGGDSFPWEVSKKLKY